MNTSSNHSHSTPGCASPAAGDGALRGEVFEDSQRVHNPSNARHAAGRSLKAFSTSRMLHNFVRGHWGTVDHQEWYRYYNVLRYVQYGNAGFLMFRTCNGSFGIMQTSAAAAGDILCVVPSCRVPLALRKVESSKYLLVGPTGQIVETMHAEVAQAAKNPSGPIHGSSTLPPTPYILSVTLYYVESFRVIQATKTV